MTGLSFIDWVVGTLTAIVGIVALWAGARKTLADGNSLKHPKAPYDALEQRVLNLEQSDAAKSASISRLRTQVYRLAGALTREVSTVITWYETGKPEPPPDKEVEVLKRIINDIKADEDSRSVP